MARLFNISLEEDLEVSSPDNEFDGLTSEEEDVIKDNQQLQSEVEKDVITLEQKMAAVDMLEEQQSTNEQLIENQPESITEAVVAASNECLAYTLGVFGVSTESYKVMISKESNKTAVENLLISTESIGETVKKAAQAVIDFIKGIFKKIWEWIQKLLEFIGIRKKKKEEIADVAEELAKPEVKEAIQEKVEELKKDPEFKQKVAEKVQEQVSAIKELAKQGAEELSKTGGNVVRVFSGVFKQARELVKSKSAKAADQAESAAQQQAAVLAETMETIKETANTAGIAVEDVVHYLEGNYANAVMIQAIIGRGVVELTPSMLESIIADVTDTKRLNIIEYFTKCKPEKVVGLIHDLGGQIENVKESFRSQLFKSAHKFCTVHANTDKVLLGSINFNEKSISYFHFSSDAHNIIQGRVDIMPRIDEELKKGLKTSVGSVSDVKKLIEVSAKGDDKLMNFIKTLQSVQKKVEENNTKLANELAKDPNANQTILGNLRKGSSFCMNHIKNLLSMQDVLAKYSALCNHALVGAMLKEYDK